MTLNDTSRLIAPPIEEEIYPYRRVWNSIILESTILVILAVSLFIVNLVVSIEFANNITAILATIVAVLPALLWVIFSYRREMTVPQPRPQLFIVFILSMLAANAVGIPLINDSLQPHIWLAQASTVNRIIGFSVTIGVVQELIKYMIIRYIAWGEHYRTRYDSLAYCSASAIGYSVVMNIHFVTTHSATLDVVAAHVLFSYTVHLSGSLIVSYGLAQSSLSNVASVLLLPFSFVVGVFVSGAILAIRNDIHNATLVLSATSRPLFSLAFIVGFLYLLIIIVALLYRIAESQEQT